MIRGYVVLVARDSPLPAIPAPTAFYRKAGVEFSTDDNERIFINVEGTDHAFEVRKNVRNVITEVTTGSPRGLLRISFIRPELDLIVVCNCKEVETFAKVVLILSKLSRVRKRTLSRRERFCNPLAEYYDGDCLLDPSASDVPFYSSPFHYILPENVSGYRIIREVTLKSYPLLKTLKTETSGLIEIPEEIGLLPCLTNVSFSGNQLGHAKSWNWLTSPIIRKSLCSLYLDRNDLSSVPEAITGLANLEILSLRANHLTELPAAMGNLKYLRNLHVQDNKLDILPAWMYRNQRFFALTIKGNPFRHAESKYYEKKKLNPEDFATVVVPSLFYTVAKFIITERLAFWEYNIPKQLTSHLEGGYYCRCGSVGFHDKMGQVIQHKISPRILATYCDIPAVPITIHCCTYKCYNLLNP